MRWSWRFPPTARRAASQFGEIVLVNSSSGRSKRGVAIRVPTNKTCNQPTRPAINAGARNFRKLFGEIPLAAPGSMVKELNCSGRGTA